MATTAPAADRNADGDEQGRRKKKGGFRTMPLILGEFCTIGSERNEPR
jgi:hypothetical protein